jgi:hypothetical protein
LRTGIGGAQSGSGREAVAEFIPFPMVPLPSGGGRRVGVSAPGPEDTAAGRFPACQLIADLGNIANDYHRFCPGVGFVRSDLTICSAMHGQVEVHELVRYHLPTLRVREADP